MGSTEGACEVLRISAPGVGIEPFTARFPETATVILAATSPCPEFDVGATLCTRVGTEASGFNRDFFNCSKSNRNGREEHRAAAFESIRRVVDSVDSYVHSTTR